MLHLQAFTFNPFQENTYILHNEYKECWIIDPGMYDESELIRFNTYIAANGLKPVSIINTHAHIDHILGVNALKSKYNIPFGMHEMEQPVLKNAVGSAMMFGLEFGPTPQADFYISEKESLKLGDDTLEVRFSPGHSPGSIIFYNAQAGWAVGGDVLFQGSIGRTDLPGGNFETLINSIRGQLFTLPTETVVYPGHGPETTIGEEMAHNPFLN